MTGAPHNSYPRASVVQILHLEDNSIDRDLIRSVLQQGGINCQIDYTQTREGLLSALKTKSFDLVLGDQTLPGFDGISALKIVKQLYPDLPFIFVSGSMGEEAAIETMRLGADDYVLKDRPARLPSAIERAISEAHSREQQTAAEAKIKKQARLLDKANDAILVCDVETRIIFWNRGAERIYGWSAEEATGKPLSELLAKVHSPRLEEARKQTLRNKEWSGELLYFSKDGKVVITESRWTLVPDDDGQSLSILSINENITEKKQLEAQYLRAQRMESIGILAGGIAHDLNNVLSPILMISQLLRMHINTPEVVEMVDTLESSAKHGGELIKQILSFARGVEGDRVEIQISHLIREMQKMLRETLPRAIQIQTKVPKDLWTIKGVPTHLNQVLMNLCVNARDAMPEGGQLTISAENVLVDEAHYQTRPEIKIGAYVVVSVADTGSGIPPEVLARIYDPFFTTKDIGKGTGLGLSTVRNIVKNHGGYLHVHSVMGKGTTFSAYFPAAASESGEGVEQERLRPPKGNGQGILVVDDEAAVLRVTTIILERNGYRVFTATNGAEGVAVFAKERNNIHLVLADMMMPIMDGVAMTRALQSLDPGVKTVILTGLAESHKMSELSKGEGRFILQKPYSSEELLTTVGKVLGESA